jgi:cytochrome c6
MRSLGLKRILFTVLLLAAVLFSFTPSVLAADLTNGAKVFGANCASCHMNGRNMVNPAKTLQKADLEKYEMASIDAIQNQVRNGKGAMPAFKGRLNDAQIEDVATYVLDQAEQGWKS